MKKFKLLVFIDDDYPTNVFHEIILEESKTCEEYLFFESAIDALTFFEEESKKENPLVPDAILLDINMPQMSGWEFIEEFEKLHLTDDPIIIMLSTSLHASDQEKGENLNIVKDFFQKPLSVEHLLDLRSNLLID